jgi:hypothetical protein
MWIRYAVTTAGDVIREDARTTAEMSEIVISEISLHFWDRVSLESGGLYMEVILLFLQWTTRQPRRYWM